MVRHHLDEFLHAFSIVPVVLIHLGNHFDQDVDCFHRTFDVLIQVGKYFLNGNFDSLVDFAHQKSPSATWKQGIPRARHILTTWVLSSNAAMGLNPSLTIWSSISPLTT